MRQLRFVVIVIVLLFLGIPGLTATEGILVRVLNMTLIEGVPGVVLLVRSDQSRKYQAYVTDSNGSVIVQPLSGNICTVTSFDPSRLFYNKTTEFDCHSSPVMLVLPVRPVIERVSLSGSVKLRIAIYGPGGKLLPKQNILLRPSIVTFEIPHVFLITTDTTGSIDTQLSPGDYTLATLINGKPYEAALLVTAKGQKCPKTSQICVSLSTPSNAAKSIDVHLVIPSVHVTE
jgi:hypothetical protein